MRLKRDENGEGSFTTRNFIICTVFHKSLDLIISSILNNKYNNSSGGSLNVYPEGLLKCLQKRKVRRLSTPIHEVCILLTILILLTVNKIPLGYSLYVLSCRRPMTSFLLRDIFDLIWRKGTLFEAMTLLWQNQRPCLVFVFPFRKHLI